MLSARPRTTGNSIHAPVFHRRRVSDPVAPCANSLRVFFWLRPPTRFAELEKQSEVTERLNEALRRAGIDFPYPTRVLRLQANEALPIHVEP